MKKGLLISIINWLFVFSIPSILLTANINTNTIDSNIDVKNLNTSLFQKIIDSDIVVEKNSYEEEQDSVDKKEIPVIKNEKEEEKIKIETKKEEKQTVVEPEKKQEEPPKEEKKSDVIATYSGKASYYTANCYGCGGYTSSGLNVSDGRLYYNDSSYGNVRIIAAGREIPLYSIVRLTNTKVGSNVLAIVLDRGGDIGEGRVFLIDILTNSEESFGGVDKNVKVEVLRSGR